MRPTLVIALAVGALAGCGPDTGSGRTACELLTPADVNRVIPKAEATRARDDGDKVRSHCEISGSRATFVSVIVDRNAGEDAYGKHRASQAARRDSRYEAISGVGDAAHGYESGSASHVMARQDDATVNVAVYHGVTGREHARQLVEIALRRL
jgi:hypothetical protein